jgi:septum formation inhibitor-activating ATPase MinD
MHSEVRYSSTLSLIVFEILKQKGCYEYILEDSYSGIKHGLQNTIATKENNERKIKGSFH